MQLLTPKQTEKIARQIVNEISSLSVRWMKLRFAAKYIGINKDRLIKLAKDGEVIGYPDPDNKRGDWIFDRDSLDRYRLDQRKEFENKVLELSKRF